MIDIVIDGQKTTVDEGMTVLGAARALGIEIPTLCFHRGLQPHRACRVCTVEVIRGDKTSYLTACSYRITEPLSINTRSVGALEKRRTVIEGLLNASPGSSALVAVARDAGIEYQAQAGGERCIRCGLCVRVCDEVVGQKALSYEKGSAGTPYLTVTDACIGCRTCATLCPVGAIVVEEENGKRRFPQGNREFPLVLCGLCGRPVATRPHLEAIRRRRPPEGGDDPTCAECRRASFAEDIVRGGPAAVFTRR
jgi:bidirectional [NiFe] hydrogenase diaphorase subunit